MRANIMLLIGWLAFASAAADDATPDTFRRDIAPLLVERCLRCHSGDEPK